MTTEAPSRADVRFERVIQELRAEYASARMKKTKRIHVELFMHDGILDEGFVEAKRPIDLQCR